MWQRDEDLKEKADPSTFLTEINPASNKHNEKNSAHTTQVKVAANVVTGSDQGRRTPLNAFVTNGIRQKQDKSVCGICGSIHTKEKCAQLLVNPITRFCA